MSPLLYVDNKKILVLNVIKRILSWGSQLPSVDVYVSYYSFIFIIINIRKKMQKPLNSKYLSLKTLVSALLVLFMRKRMLFWLTSMDTQEQNV